MAESASITLTLFAAFVFAIVHLLAGKLRFLEGIPRSRWLSFAGGISVAYVFLHLLPELSEGQEQLANVISFLENHVYLIALAGLMVFYGLERLAVSDRGGSKESAEGTSPGTFWLHITSFAVYNALIGYLLLHREEQDPQGLLWYFIAMSLHFIVNDFGLREHHKHRYHTPGRWILAAAILIGWAVGLLTEVTEAVINVLFAFLAGGVILNILKEEMPEQRKSRFWAFALGCIVYAALLLYV